MLKINAQAFYEATTIMTKAREYIQISHGDVEHPDGSITYDTLDSETLRMVKEHAKDLLDACALLGVPATMLSIKRLLRDLEASSSPLYSTVSTAYREIDSRLRDELSLVSLFVLERAEANYFEPVVPLFGNTVAERFQSLTYEIGEVGKCLALQRSTAAVFHSIRCLEAGIKAIARCLAIPDPIKGVDRSWGNVLRSIKDETDRRWPSNSAGRLSADAKFFEKSHAALHAMMNPYRNDTMHLEAKYTEDEAKHIFEVVKGFMAVVASRCDEEGEPKA
jgi:hypothetical protein